MLRIEMPRGDIHHIQFSVVNQSGTNENLDFDEIFFTVKDSYNRSGYLFQKKLSDGSIVKDGDVYTFTINPEDTNSLQFKTYVFDIEVLSDNTVKSTFVGNLHITEEVTYQENE